MYIILFNIFIKPINLFLAEIPKSTFKPTYLFDIIFSVLRFKRSKI